MTRPWTLTVFNGDLQWYRVLGDDEDWLNHEKKRAKEQGFDYEAQYDDMLQPAEGLPG